LVKRYFENSAISLTALCPQLGDGDWHSVAIGVDHTLPQDLACRGLVSGVATREAR